MKPAKVVNKILLSYLGLGAIFGIGVVVENENIQKALLGTGAVASLACVAGTMATKNNQSDRSDENNHLLDDRSSELRIQQEQLQKSLDEKTAQMQTVETDINSLQNEHNQLLSVVSNLNEQKEQLENESRAWDDQIQSKKQELDGTIERLTANQKQEEILGQNIATLENQKHILNNEVEQLSSKQQQLEQAISPIEENIADVNVEATYQFAETIQLKSDAEDETDLENSFSSLNETEESIDSDTNPSTSHTSPETEISYEGDENSNLEIVDRLVESLSESQVETFKSEQFSSTEPVDALESDSFEKFSLETDRANEKSESLITGFADESDSSEEFSLEESNAGEAEELMSFDDESDSAEVFNLEESSTDEAEELMMSFNDESDLFLEESDADEFKMHDVDAIDEEALETAENKIKILNQISDESFEELNDLLGSIQQENLEEKYCESEELHQENKMNS